MTVFQLLFNYQIILLFKLNFKLFVLFFKTKHFKFEMIRLDLEFFFNLLVKFLIRNMIHHFRNFSFPFQNVEIIHFTGYLFVALVTEITDLLTIYLFTLLNWRRILCYFVYFLIGKYSTCRLGKTGTFDNCFYWFYFSRRNFKC